MAISVSVKKRYVDGIKKYRPILTKAQSQDVNESDTVTIITDILSDILGYDKYSEITSEVAIKKTFCDLAIKINDSIKLLIEVKSAGLNLKDNHLAQAVNYGANAGIEWVVLTNGVEWNVYKIIFGQPISHELIYSFNMTEINHKKEDDLNMLHMLSKETMSKKSNLLSDFYSQKQLLNKFSMAQIILSEPVIGYIRRTLKSISSDTKVTPEEIYEVLSNEVIKRDLLEDEKAKELKRKITRALKK